MVLFLYLHTHPSGRTVRQDFYTEGASVPNGEWGSVLETCPTRLPQLLSVWEHVKKVKLSGCIWQEDEGAVLRNILVLCVQSQGSQVV